uniref:Uncharacterized protein n=1 Tax=Lepeophtheirus salmonis TaxID=72036 RepID=A0A0K2V7T3_LEPSM
MNFYNKSGILSDEISALENEYYPKKYQNNN